MHSIAAAPLTTPDLVAVDFVASDRADVVRHLSELLATADRVSDVAEVRVEVAQREVQVFAGAAEAVRISMAAMFTSKVGL